MFKLVLERQRNQRSNYQHLLSHPLRATHVGTILCLLRRPLLLVAGLVCCFIATACGSLISADVKRGDQHLAAGNWEEATVAYRQALKDAPFDLSLQNK